MKKSKLILIFILVIITSCNSESEIIKENIVDKTLFAGYKIETDQGHEDECPDCEEYFDEKISDGSNSLGTCFSGARKVIPGKNYLYKLAIGSTDSTEFTWDVSEEMDVLHKVFVKKQKYTVSFCVIKYKKDFKEGYIKAYSESGGVSSPIGHKK